MVLGLAEEKLALGLLAAKHQHFFRWPYAMPWAILLEVLTTYLLLALAAMMSNVYNEGLGNMALAVS